VAYCRFGQQSGRWEIWVVDLANGVHQFLEYGLFPQWNPDPAKNKILFQRARERGSRLFSIWTIDYVDGEAMHRTEILAASNAAVMHPAWSPDGNRVVFVTVLNPDLQQDERPAQSDVWVVNLNGTGKANLTNGQYLNLYPVWSTDGTVFFLSDRSGTDNIWAVAAGSTNDLRGFSDGELAATDPDLERADDRP
jgi:Tol biopolymer transport system component